MVNRQEIATLRARVEETKAAFLEAREAEKEAFETRFTGFLEGTMTSIERWRAQHDAVMRAYVEWTRAVDLYLAAVKREQ